MLALLRHLLSADYLYAPRPVPAGLASAGFAGWALGLLALSLCAAAWHRAVRSHGGSPSAPRLTLALLLAASLALASQALSDGPLSARIWTLTLSGLALTIPLCTWLARRPAPASLQPILRALACTVRPEDQPLSPRATMAWLLGHALALGSALILSLGDNRAGQDPRAILLALFAGLVALALSGYAAAHSSGGRRVVQVELLAPLLLPYLVMRVQWFVAHTLGVDTGAYHAYPFPDLWSPWFDPAIPWLIAAAWMLLSAAAWLRRARPDAERWLRGLAAAGGLGWLGALFGRHLSAGAGGSDPYAYLQMAADLATTGDLRHAFPLVPLALEAGVPLWPLVPVGYHPPLTGVAATVWPPGWPVLLAPLYRLGGEWLALWGAPLCLLLCGWLTLRLANRLWAPTGQQHIMTIGALAVALHLTSHEVLTRSLVPMADAAAAAATLLTLLALLRARATDRLGWSALAGLSLALAYTIRHPLLPLALAAVPALVMSEWPWRRRLAHLALFGAGALAGAIPDLWYHRLAFGSPWVSESAEWFLLSPTNIPATLASLWRGDLLRSNEFGYLWPLILAGLWAALRAREERASMLILLTGGSAVLLFHLSYEALRLRDLIPLFPLLALWAARGTSAAWDWANRGAHPQARRTLIALALLFLLLARTTATLALPLQDRVETFGHLTSAQRMTYERLGASLPETTVVAAAASAGPVLRYAGREIVRPAAWTLEEFDRMLRVLESDGRALVLLADGEEMQAWLPGLEGRYTTTLLSRWALPLYGRGGQPLPGQAELYAIERP